MLRCLTLYSSSMCGLRRGLRVGVRAERLACVMHVSCAVSPCVDCGGCTVVQLCRLWVHALAVFNIYVRPRLQNVSSLQTERAICKLSRRLPVCKKRLPVCKLSRRLHAPVCKLRHIVCKLGTSLQTKRGSYTALFVHSRVYRLQPPVCRLHTQFENCARPAACVRIRRELPPSVSRSYFFAHA